MKIGIDFGTTFSLPAAIINGQPDTLLPNGEYGLPSLFYYDKEMGIRIGKAARDEGEYNSANLVREIKMEINQSNNNYTLDGKTFTKEDIVTSILNHITQTAQDEIQRRILSTQSIEGVVIAVPVAFTLREIDFIRKSAQLPRSKGGPALNVYGFIREPVAAAIAYFHADRENMQRTILVYDLGGGTCDVAIVRANSQISEQFEVIASDMMRVGGRDWDKVMLELIKRKYQARAGNIRFTPDDERKLLVKATEAKTTLSAHDRARVSHNIDGRPHACIIERSEFEQSTTQLLKSTMQMVDRLVSKHKTTINDIVLVGGGSNMPQVKNIFQTRYSGIKVHIYEPEKAIAYGAAIYAQHVGNPQFLRDICKFSYGSRYIEDYSTYRDENRLRVYNTILKGSKLPASGTELSKKFKDGQDSTYIAIYESDRVDRMYLPEQGTYIGDIVIHGLKNSKQGDETELTMTVDQSGLMTLKAVDKRTQKIVEATIQLKDF